MATELNSSAGLDRTSIPPQTDAGDTQDWSAVADDYGVDTEWTPPLVDPRMLTKALGWFSIGLGLAEIFAPRSLGRAIGVGDQPALLRLCGLRELTSGIGLLSERLPSRWAMSRVAGDAMDLALLGAAARQEDSDRVRISLAAAAVTAVTALDVYATQQLRDVDSEHEPYETVLKSVTINATPEALYAFWRKLDNFPRFMQHLESVHETSERTSHWIAKAPAGTTIEWDAEIVEDEVNSRLAWRTLPSSQIEHEGIVSFEPATGGRGTIVRVEMTYVPPAGKVGVRVAKLFGEEPSIQIDTDLRRMKQLIETGEIATSTGQSSGRRSLLGRTTLGRYMS